MGYRGYRDTGSNKSSIPALLGKYRDTGIHGIQGYRDTGSNKSSIPALLDKYRNTGRYRDTWIQGYSNTKI